jgi:hypothetical protein
MATRLKLGETGYRVLRAAMHVLEPVQEIRLTALKG